MENPKFLILHIEDEKSARDEVLDQLEGLPVEVLSVDSIKEAELMLEPINIIEKELYLVIILDIDMQGKNGINFLKKFKEKKDIPVIIFSGSKSKKDRLDAEDIKGFKTFISKDEIEDSVRKEIEKIILELEN